MDQFDDIPPVQDCDRETVTRTLDRLCHGDEAAEPELSLLVYQDMRRLAGSILLRERAGHTLQATALVHEAWLRMVDLEVLGEVDREVARRRFLANAAKVMRRVLVEHARGRLCEKRGGGARRVPLTEIEAAGHEAIHARGPRDLLDIDTVLCEVAEEQPRMAQIAELRIYGGLSSAEAADVVGVSLATAKADWALARARLTLRIRGCSDDTASRRS